MERPVKPDVLSHLRVAENVGYPEKKHRADADVHHKGKAAVSAGDQDKIEDDVAKLHAAGLWGHDAAFLTGEQS